MNDMDVRNALFSQRLRRYDADPQSVIVPELAICQGEARIDVALVNGHLVGYEIKSDEDTLDRLARQIVLYSKVFDRVVLITGVKHADKAIAQIPTWWGVEVAQARPRMPRLSQFRRARMNPSVDPFALAQLLWKDETLDLLAVHGGNGGFKSKSRDVLWAELVSRMTIIELKKNVRATLKAREPWWAARK